MQPIVVRRGVTDERTIEADVVNLAVGGVGGEEVLGLRCLFKNELEVGTGDGVGIEVELHLHPRRVAGHHIEDGGVADGVAFLVANGHHTPLHLFFETGGETCGRQQEHGQQPFTETRDGH